MGARVLGYWLYYAGQGRVGGGQHWLLDQTSPPLCGRCEGLEPGGRKLSADRLPRQLCGGQSTSVRVSLVGPLLATSTLSLPVHQ